MFRFIQTSVKLWFLRYLFKIKILFAELCVQGLKSATAAILQKVTTVIRETGNHK